MNIIIRGHPGDRLRERGIAVADVKHALLNFTSSWATPKGGIEYQGPGRDGRVLKVWLLPPGLEGDHGRLVLKSAAWKDQED